MSSFEVRLPDGQRFENVPAIEVMAWAREGRICCNTMIRRNGSRNWRCVEDVPAIQAELATQPAHGNIAPRMSSPIADERQPERIESPDGDVPWTEAAEQWAPSMTPSAGKVVSSTMQVARNSTSRLITNIAIGLLAAVISWIATSVYQWISESKSTLSRQEERDELRFQQEQFDRMSDSWRQAEQDRQAAADRSREAQERSREWSRQVQEDNRRRQREAQERADRARQGSRPTGRSSP